MLLKPHNWLLLDIYYRLDHFYIFQLKYLCTNYINPCRNAFSENKYAPSAHAFAMATKLVKIRFRESHKTKLVKIRFMD
ncbi:hypothetical protein EO92_06395 [Methanosarcina sp. 2.H.A.1B.4]|nr:hypothetical protein EO92_06395 [Methanosarcina sp. 2.H.A.1B.4]